jgi:hypothetical protein
VGKKTIINYKGDEWLKLIGRPSKEGFIKVENIKTGVRLMLRALEDGKGYEEKPYKMTYHERRKIREAQGLSPTIEVGEAKERKAYADIQTGKRKTKSKNLPLAAGRKINRELFLDLTVKHLNCHPIERLAMLAQKAHEDEDSQLEFNALKELMPYIAPKLRSVEHTGDKNTQAPVQIVLNTSSPSTKTVQSEPIKGEKDESDIIEAESDT